MEFFVKYKLSIIWITSVLLAALIILFGLKKSTKYLSRKKPKFAKTINLVYRIFRISLFFILIILISYVFVDKSFYEVLNKNIVRVSWIFVVSLSTIIFAAVSRQFLLRKFTHDGDDEHQLKTFRFIDFLSSGIIYLIGFALIILAFPALRVYAQSVLAGAGVFALGLGIAAQEAISNVINGLMIIIYRPFKIGDIIKIEDTLVGEVEDITLRHTVIKNYQNKRIVVPNSTVNKNTLINYNLTDPATCVWIEIGISYNSDIDKAKFIIESECISHPLIIDQRTEVQHNTGDPMVRVKVIKLNESSVDIRAWAWAKDYNTAFTMKCDLLESIKKRFDKEGIEIPFPHRTVYMKNV